MPSPRGRSFPEGSAPSSSPNDDGSRGYTPFVEYGVVALVAILALVYAWAAFRHESVEFTSVSSSSATSTATRP